MVSKIVQIGKVGSLAFSENDGVESLVASVSASAGGGDMAGVLKGSASLELDVSGLQLINLGFGIAEAKFPSLAPLMKAAQDAIDAELAKA